MPRPVRNVQLLSARRIAIDADVRLQKTLKCLSRVFETPTKERRSDDYFDEAVVDHVSTLISWDALGSHLAHFPNAKRTLPTKSNHSFEKMFFISRAYMRCHASNYFSWKKWKTHPPGFHRINRGFSNFEGFERIFRCTAADAMVAKPRCKLFKEELGFDFSV